MTVYSIFAYVGIAALIISLLRFRGAKPKNIFINYLQNFVGSLFVFSGFVKAVDPLGTSYKMLDYFDVLRLEFLATFSVPFSVTMIVLEILAGVAIIIGWRPKLTTSVLLLMTLFFTALTGFTYISGYSPSLLFWVLFIGTISGFALAGIAGKPLYRNFGWVTGIGSLLIIWAGIKFSSAFFTAPFTETGMKVTDCGCFGDFIKLKPWETFWKDVFLDVLILFLTVNYKKVSTLFAELPRAIVAYGTAIVSFIFCLYNFVWSEPIIDFRPYKIGNNIVELRKALKPEVRDYRFIYKNKATSEEKEFSTAELSGLNYEEWEYKDRKDIIIDAGIPAKITNLFIYDEQQDDITDELLQYEGYSLVVVAYKLDKTNTSAFKQLNKLAEKSDKTGIKFYALSSDKAETFRHEHQTAYPFYQADETPLKTIMRSNPGLLLLKNGVVINKWHYKKLPEFEELNGLYFSK